MAPSTMYQGSDFCSRKIMLKTKYEFWISAAKTINALRIIPNHKKTLAAPSAQKLNQLELGSIYILIFVHQEVFRLRLVFVEDIRGILKYLTGEMDLVIEIYVIALRHYFSIFGAYFTAFYTGRFAAVITRLAL